MKYELELVPGTNFARVRTGGTDWAKLWLGAAVDTWECPDETAASVSRVIETSYGRRIEVEAVSSAWVRKTIVLECHDDCILAWVEVKGAGRLTDVSLLGGAISGPGVTGRVDSQSNFRSVYSPAPTRAQRWVRGAGESQALSVGGSPLPGQSDWFFTPPPLCYAVSLAEVPAEVMTIPAGPWTGISVIAAPGEHNFTGFEYRAQEESFRLTLTYGGQTAVRGSYKSPVVVLSFGQANPAAALADYRQRYETGHGAAVASVLPDWWSRPMFCGWGAQQTVTYELGATIQSAATRLNYDQFLAALAAQDIVPGTVVIDDKWQFKYGTNEPDPAKWPQLRSWIRRRHEVGQRVLLWLKLWDPEGLPAEECIVNHRGVPVAVDPTNPRYERRLRRQVRQMLSERGYGADGFKLDFSGHVPVAATLQRHGTAWGLELQHRLLEIIYSEAKRVRPDALVIGHVPHPYFTDVVDMIRLNDVVTEQPVAAQMAQRAEIVRAVCPERLVDADNWPMPSLSAWRDYMSVSAELGVPALYFASGLPGEPFDPNDYALIRRSWSADDAQSA